MHYFAATILLLSFYLGISIYIKFDIHYTLMSVRGILMWKLFPFSFFIYDWTVIPECEYYLHIYIVLFKHTLEPAIGNISSIMINSRAFIVAEANNGTATSSVEKHEQTIFRQCNAATTIFIWSKLLENIFIFYECIINVFPCQKPLLPPHSYCCHKPDTNEPTIRSYALMNNNNYKPSTKLRQLLVLLALQPSMPH